MCIHAHTNNLTSSKRSSTRMYTHTQTVLQIPRGPQHICIYTHTNSLTSSKSPSSRMYTHTYTHKQSYIFQEVLNTHVYTHTQTVLHIPRGPQHICIHTHSHTHTHKQSYIFQEVLNTYAYTHSPTFSKRSSTRGCSSCQESRSPRLLLLLCQKNLCAPPRSRWC